MLSRGRGERKRETFEERILELQEAKRNQRKKEKDFLRENLEKEVIFRLWILDFLKESRQSCIQRNSISIHHL